MNKIIKKTFARNFVLDLLIFLTFCAGILYHNITFTEINSSNNIPFIFQLGTAVFFVLRIYLSTDIDKTKIPLTIFYAIIVVFWCFTQPIVSPIDECAHLGYIHWIVEHGSFPLITDSVDIEWISQIKNLESVLIPIPQYEAVHPQLYYFIVSCICRFFSSPTLQFWACRLFSCICLVTVFFTVSNSIEFLSQKKIVFCKKECTLVMFFFFLSPSILDIFTAATNESLAAVFSVLFFYTAIKCLFGGFSKRKWLFLTILFVFAIWSKTSTAFIYVILIILLVYLKKHKEALLSTIIISISISPWLIYNQLHYHAFSGIKEHMDFVMPIVNPNKILPDIFEPVFFLFNGCFYHRFLPVKVDIASFLGFLLLFSFIIVAFSIVRKTFLEIKEKRSFYGVGVFTMSRFIMLLAFIGNVSFFVLGTLTSRIPAIQYRYCYITILPVLYIFMTHQEIDIRIFKKLIIFCGLLIVFGNLNIVVFRTGKNFLKQPPELYTTFSQKENALKNEFLNMQEFDELRIAVWSEPDDQDDLHWFILPETKGKKKIEYSIPLEMYDTNGKYFIHVYGMKDDELIFIKGTDVSVQFNKN